MIKKQTFLLYALLSVLAISPFVFIRGVYKYVEIPQSAFIQISAIVLFLFFAVNLIRNKSDIKMIKDKSDVPILLFMVISFIYSIFAVNKFESFTLYAHYFACFLIFILVGSLVSGRDVANKIIYTILSTGVMVSIIGICQHLFGFDYIPQSLDPASTFANKNMAAQFIVLTFPLVATIKNHKKLALLSGFLMLLFLFFSGCIAAWVAVSLEILFMLIVFNFAIVKHLFTLKFTAGMIFVALLALSLHFGQNLYDKPSSKQRLDMWGNTIEMIKDNPIGVGLNNHSVIYPKYQKYHNTTSGAIFNEATQVIHTHNDFLQLVAEVGVLGAVIVVWIAFLFYRSVFYCCKNKDLFLISIAICAAVSGIIVNSFFSFPFHMPIPPLVLAVYLAIIFSLSNDKKHSISIKRWIAFATVIVLIPAIFYASKYHYNNIKKDRYLLYAKYFEQQKNWRAVSILSKEAYSLNPYCKKLLAYSARASIETGDYDRGVEYLKQVLKVYPYNMNSITNMGIAYMLSGKYSAAQECFNRVLEIKPDNHKAIANIRTLREVISQNGG